VSAPDLERFLAALYADASALRRFLGDPAGEAARAGLGPDEARALEAMDRGDLLLAARSFERKRNGSGRPAV
jgi:hypothetical protein